MGEGGPHFALEFRLAKTLQRFLFETAKSFKTTTKNLQEVCLNLYTKYKYCYSLAVMSSLEILQISLLDKLLKVRVLSKMRNENVLSGHLNI